MRSPPSFHIFGTYTRGSSTGTTNHSDGYSIGGFGQTSHLLGLEARGSYLRWGMNERRYDAMLGPRVSVHIQRFAPYGAILIGVGHADTWQTVNTVNLYGATATGAEWKILGGVDFYWRNRVSIRLADISYGKVYVFKNGLSPIDYSAGIVYRFPVGGH